MNYININDLDVIGEVKLIFEANLDLSKGKSNKSYSIKLPDTSRNNNALQGMFSSYIGRKVSYPAIYTVQGVTLTGVLLITDIERHLASGVFISGNGVVWQAMQDDNLSDIDLSEYDIELNKTNVLASESGYPMVVFDMTDRGAFKSGLNSIDITDRFPALNVKQLFTELFNYYGFYLNIEDNTGYFEQLYLLFTGSDEVRNSSDWLKDSIFEAQSVGYQQYDDFGPSSQPAFEVYEKLKFPIENEDAGGNYNPSTWEYTVPETGTYNFIYDYYLEFSRPSIATVSGLSASIRLFKNGTAVGVHLIDVDELETESIVIISGRYNSSPVEYQAGDIISMYIYFSGTITSSSSWVVMVAQYTDSTQIKNLFYQKPSRWYGAGSTIRINSILPGMTVKDFISGACQLLNADLFYNEDENAVTLVVGQKQVAPVAEVECFNYTEVLEEKTNTVIAFSTDKARPQPDKLVKIVGAKDTVTNDLKYSRTLIAPCSRLFSVTDVQIPVLWQAGDPLDFDQADNPPEQKTQANLRILRKATAASGSYALTYGGVLASNSETRSTVLQMQEVDIRSLHIQELATERKLIQCDARLDVSKLYDNTYFKNDVTLVDRRNGLTLLNGRIKRAEQLRVDWFRITLYPTAQEQIDPSQVDWFAPLDATNTTAPGGVSGAGGGGTEPLPADMWRSSTTGQIDGLTEKTTPVDADDFVIDDSAAGNAKKKVSWASIKTALSSFFYGAFAAQFNGTAAKTSLANDDVFVIEDSAATPTAYIKKSIKWSSIRTILNNVYYGAIAGQFAATTEKTSIAANDYFIIEDSAASNAKKSFKYSTLKTALDALYGFWSSVTGGIRTNNRVGINTNPGTGTGLKVSDSNYGIDAKSTGNGALRAEIEGSASFSSAPVIPLYRSTTSTAVNGIGMSIPFYIQNSAGSFVAAAYLEVKLSDATSGSEKAEMSFIVNSAVRAKINTENDLEVSSGSSPIVQSGDAYYLGAKATDGSWRITRSGNDLVLQRRESGTWVTKQTISA